MSSKDHLSDAATRHQVFVQRYSTGVARRYNAGLKKTYSEILARLAEQDLTATSAAKLTAIRTEIDQILAKGDTQQQAKLVKELNDFVLNEADFSGRLLSAGTAAEFSATIPAAAQLETALALKTFQPAGTNTLVNIEQAISKFGASNAESVRQVVRDGFLLGDTNATISQNIKSVQKVANHQAEALARTMTNHASSVARSEIYAANDIEQYQWLSTLDNRTTMTCAGRDGKIYDVQGDNPRPPAHFNCRSATIPVVDPELDLGGKGLGKRSARGLDGKSTEVSSQTTFGSWLKKQPAEFQDEYFGKFTNGDQKARLFKQGRLSIDKFTDAKGAEYSLDQLRQLNPVAFAKAGI